MITDTYHPKAQVNYPYEISGYPRFCEAARYWMQWAGIPDSVYSDSHGKNDYTDDYKVTWNLGELPRRRFCCQPYRKRDLNIRWTWLLLSIRMPVPLMVTQLSAHSVSFILRLIMVHMPNGASRYASRFMRSGNQIS